MNSVVAGMLTRLYPRAWRERYGLEFEALLADGEFDLKSGMNVIWSAMKERMVPTRGGKMEQPVYSFVGVMKQWSAFLPVAMSLTALLLVIGPIPFYGIPVREPDEGAIAHIWQILMAGQLPVLLFFAIQWLRKAPRQALGVLAVQAGAVLAAMAPVFYFNL